MDTVTALTHHTPIATAPAQRRGRVAGIARTAGITPGPGIAGMADLASRHRYGVSTLLAARADLRGVHAFADLLEESVLWSA